MADLLTSSEKDKSEKVVAYPWLLHYKCRHVCTLRVQVVSALPIEQTTHKHTTVCVWGGGLQGGLVIGLSVDFQRIHPN